MARMVRHEATGPQKVDPSDKPVFVCMCGLSQDLPFCDGSHNKSRKEEAGKLYVYDAARCEVQEVCEDQAEQAQDADGGAV